ncbi:MAG: hypothetical protein R3C46_02185 [Hyphomonadaceae bacterium]
MLWIALTALGVGVVALAVMGMVIAHYVHSYERAKLGKPDPAPAAPHDDDLRDEVARLRGRVATLERLATDGDHRLSAEIDRLSRGEVSSRV